MLVESAGWVSIAGWAMQAEDDTAHGREMLARWGTDIDTMRVMNRLIQKIVKMKDTRLVMKVISSLNQSLVRVRCQVKLNEKTSVYCNQHRSRKHLGSA